MKVLFAVNNDDISETIIEKYQKEYKEILSYKNVYYFNAILKELQRDKSYDRVVISEDLEPFANNNYDTIDKFLFERLDKISDETEENTEIVLICTDRRTRSDDMMLKIFSIGIYNAILGSDRKIEEVCKLLYKPRGKKEAKQYYKIETDNVNYQAEDENNVSEAEVQNILAHYKRLGKNEDKYVDSFNNIVSQYTDNQLKIIIRYLPIGVKAVLEAKSPKYQELITFGGKSIKTSNKDIKVDTKKEPEEAIKIKMLEKESSKQRISKPIIIPSSVSKNQVKRLIKETPKQEEDIEDIEDIDIVDVKSVEHIEKNSIENDLDDILRNVERDIPQKSQEDVQIDTEIDDFINTEEPKKGRGRPRKYPVGQEPKVEGPKRGRGRPKKNVENINDELKEEQEIDEEETVDLFNLENEENDTKQTISQQEEKDEEIDLFSLDDEEEQEEEQENEEKKDEEIDLFSLDDEEEQEEEQENEEKKDEEIDLFSLDDDTEQEEQTEKNEEDIDLFGLEENDSVKEKPLQDEMVQTEYKPSSSGFGSSLTKDKKIIAFVGTTKNGTSFVVNNLGEMLSSMGISTAILDLTKSKNAYYIYTNNEEELRKKAENSIFKLKSGIADGVQANKNLSIYTGMPTAERDYSDAKAILETLAQNYSITLIDCDFDTPIEYFENAQEIYLVQSMDVLTIQPLTAFLRNLKAKNILRQDKLKIVINKYEKMRSLSVKTLIGGIAFYNDPGMSYMTELFNKDMVNYCVIPFETQNYIKYLEALVNCSLNLKGYTKTLMSALRDLANMAYPLVNKQTYSPRGDGDNFSNQMNDTLSKMKKYQQ